MCSAKKPSPPAPDIPLPAETTTAASVDMIDPAKKKKSGRASLMIPASGGSSGLNIPT